MPHLDVQPELQKEFEAFEREQLSSSWIFDVASKSSSHPQKFERPTMTGWRQGLKRCDDNEDLRTLDDAGNGDWMETHFAAVMRLSPRGEANGVYIVYNFYPDHNLTGDRFRRYPGLTWGYFGETEMQFSCAKIADRISDLDLFRPFELTEVVGYPVEIVRVIKSGSGYMVRATVAKLD